MQRSIDVDHDAVDVVAVVDNFFHEIGAFACLRFAQALAVQLLLNPRQIVRYTRINSR